jgi:hypothetical protein
MLNLFIFISLAFNILLSVGIDPLNLFYIIYFFLLILSLMQYGLFSDLTIKINLIDLIPLTMIIIWYYGLILGIARNNNIYFAFRNFFGMNLYLFYYVLIIKKIPTYSIIRVLLYSSATILILSIILFFLVRFGNLDSENPVLKLILGRIYTGSSTGKGRLWFLGQTLVFILLALSFSRILSPKAVFKKIKFQNKINFIHIIKNLFLSVLIFSMCCFVIFFMTDSAGNALAGICILLAIAFCLFFPKILQGKLHFGSIIFISVIAILTSVLILTTYSDIIRKIFTSEGNIDRIIQIKYLTDDLTPMGHGLGAIIPGYSRNEELPYGFEIIYLNIFHKFGIFAIVIMLIYLYTIVTLLKRIMTSHEYEKKIMGFICLGALAYIFISIGNPIAFSSTSVLLHCIVLYIIRNDLGPIKRYLKDSALVSVQ